MEFETPLNLIYKGSIAVVSSLWNHEDIVNDVSTVLFDSPNPRKWTEIEDKVHKCLMSLDIPYSLKSNIQNFIQPMGVQILKWIDLVRTSFRSHECTNKTTTFVWSDNGILDYIKTTESVIERNYMHKHLCFCLACIFCIEETIRNLWPDVKDQLSQNPRRDFGTFESMAVVYWEFYLNSEIENLMNLTEYYGGRSPAEFGLIFYFDIKCMSSLNHFLKQIDVERKKKVIVLALFQIICRTNRPREGNTLILIFRFINEFDIINQIICENAYPVLSSFLEWPSVNFFIQLATCFWDHLTASEYMNLLQDIVEIRSRFYIGDLYRDVFHEFWSLSPSNFKKYTIQKCVTGTLLSRLFLFENAGDILQIIFNDCTLEEKRNMIFNFEGMNTCDMLIKKGRWISLKMLVKNCISSDLLEEFLVQYQNYKPAFWNKETEMRTQIFVKNVKEWY